MTASIQGLSGRRNALLGGAALAVSWLIWRTAWVSDDAFISLRTAFNWLHGFGLTWNPDERVQAFTHPLWLFALTAAHAATGEPFYATLYLSWAVSSAAVAVLAFAKPGGVGEKLLSLFVLAFSQAFVDFSSSGLENPLSHLLIAAFAAAYVSPAAPSPRRDSWLAAVAGLAALNRLDTALLFAPALLANAWRGERSLRAALRLGWAVAPVALWELFSLVYYGFPFPNTAYAKLAQGPDTGGQRALEGLLYTGDSLRHDPLTLCAIAGCVALALWRRDARRSWLLAGAVSYVAYVIVIGGDFMRGRFFSAPLFTAMLCLATSDWLRTARERGAAAAIAAALALLGRAPPPFTGADYGKTIAERTPGVKIHDERRMFFAVSSLRNARAMNPSHPDHPWARSGLAAKAAAAADPRARVRVVDAIGYAGYYAGPGVHLVDRWALADALLARLPAAFGRYGHYPRVIPRGYLETLATRTNRIADPDLAAYYAELAPVLRGPLWSARRLHAIWELNTGAYAKRLDAYAYFHGQRFTPRVRVRNPTDHPCVVAYVWSAGMVSSYFLDLTSTRGKTYEVRWEISALGARLLAPELPAVTSLPALAPRGGFTISVAFMPAPTAPVREVYELRYAYTLDKLELALQRHGWPASNRDMSRADTWRDGDVSGVLEVQPPPK
jgi:arabinofuranosyltransferase